MRNEIVTQQNDYRLLKIPILESRQSRKLASKSSVAGGMRVSEGGREFRCEQRLYVGLICVWGLVTGENYQLIDLI